MKVIQVYKVLYQSIYKRCIVCHHLKKEIYEIENTKTYICADCVEVKDVAI